MSKILARCQRLLLNAGRYFETVRYLRLRQVVWRAYLRVRRQVCLRSDRIKRRLHAMALAHAHGLSLREPGPFLEKVNWNEFSAERHLHVAQKATELEFEFLNEAQRFRGKIDWSCPQHSQLWRYNLHYHAYLVSLGIAYQLRHDRVFFDVFKAIVEDWIAHNPMPNGDGWHPYPASLRVVNWLLALHLFKDCLDQDPGFKAKVRVSLAEQIDYVFSNLEFDVGGNHLLENIKALCLAGLYFSGRSAERWLRRGLVLLEKEIGRQILGDGGHYERSPMYHSIVLEDLLVIAAALRNAGRAWPKGLGEKLERMASFLGGLTHPDGHIALFNDSAFGISEEPAQLLRVVALLLGKGEPRAAVLDAKYALFIAAGRQPVKSYQRDPGTSRLIQFPETGYYVVDHGDRKLLVDVGPVCPDDLPAHAHADILSYELSIAGVRWVVDSGVREYAAGSWRDYARSTRAHNTVSVNGHNQVDVWASFRVGRRVKPVNVCAWFDSGITAICGKHLGFGRSRPHMRIVIDLKGEAWVVIDEVGGVGTATVESFIHFHPDVQVELKGQVALLSQSGSAARLLTAGFDDLKCLAGATDPLNGWYMPEFGVAYANPTVVGTTRKLGAPTCYVLSQREDLYIQKLESHDSKRRCILARHGEEIEIAWDVVALRPQVTRRVL